jgi:hypothetical protein
MGLDVVSLTTDIRTIVSIPNVRNLGRGREERTLCVVR